MSQSLNYASRRKLQEQIGKDLADKIINKISGLEEDIKRLEDSNATLKLDVSNRVLKAPCLRQPPTIPPARFHQNS
jgi:hypothetical protein